MWQSVARNIKTFVFFTIYYHKCLILNLLKNVVIFCKFFPLGNMMEDMTIYYTSLHFNTN